MDTISLQRISLLHPAIQSVLKTILAECDKALTGRAKVRITQGTRTHKEQDDLYALGRTKVNPDGKSSSRPLGYKVTNAKGGSSIHNFGLAVDFCLIIDGKEASWDDVKDFDGDKVSDWMEVVAIFERHGFTWGGRWSSFIDKPHFEKTFGYTLSQLQSKYAAKDFISGTTFVDIDVHRGKTETKETTANLNLRQGPGTNHKILMELPRRTQVSILSQEGSWSEVFVCDYKIKGWVSNQYLK